MNAPLVSRALLGAMAASAIAGVIVFAGIRFASSEPPDPATPSTEIVELPSNAPRVSAPAVELATPQYVNIEGKQVPLPAGMSYVRHGVINGRPDWPSTFWLVKYDSNPADAGDSWLATDENGFILGTEIRPEDEEHFRPLLVPASKIPTPTPQPLVKIGGREVPLPAGMTYSQIIWSNVGPGPTELAWVVSYSNSDQVSRLYIDEDGTVLKVDVKPEHEALFAPLLAGKASDGRIQTCGRWSM